MEVPGGHFSGLRVYNDDAMVLGVRQHQNGNQLQFWTPGVWVDIQDRSPGEWIDYRIEFNDPLTDFFVNDSLVYSFTYSPGPVNIIDFVVNGAGDPSDSWFDNVLVVRRQ